MTGHLHRVSLGRVRDSLEWLKGK
jgi:hypothetical protein